VEFPRAAPSGIPQTSLSFRGHLITNFQNIMVLLIVLFFWGEHPRVSISNAMLTIYIDLVLTPFIFALSCTHGSSYYFVIHIHLFVCSYTKSSMRCKLA
jgi:hypothetical protein